MESSVGLARLLLWNQNGALRSWQADGRGFCDARTEPKRVLCGVNTFLRDKLPGHMFPKLSKKRYFASGGARGSSSRKMGTRAHRDIHHVLWCRRGPCTCQDKKAWQHPRKGTAAYNLITAGLNFLRRNELDPVCGETVIVCQELGTRLDLLTRDKQGRLVLVSWKTGYDKLAKALPAEMERLPDMSASTRQMHPNQIALREHVAQLSIELHALQQCHQVPVQRAVLVYLHPNARHYPCWLKDEWVVLATGEMARVYQYLLSRKM